VLTFGHIICPVDLSDCSSRALRYAYAWASWYGARVRVLHVIVPEPAWTAPDSGGPPGRHRMAGIRADVQHFVSAVHNPGVPVDIEILEGRPADVILDVANRDTHSVIVMGTHGRSGIERLLMGSVTQWVAHHTARPLLVVPLHLSQAVDAAATFSRILCAVDFRASSLAALRCAVALARETDARLDLLSVITTGPAGRSGDDALPEDATLDAVAHDRLRQLRALVSDDARRDCWIYEHVRGGSPGDELLRSAADEGADLIVMGAGERMHIGVGWLGRLTDHVIRSATCPVLVVPATPTLHADRMTIVRIDDWTRELDRVTLRHQGQPTTVSVAGDVLGPELEASALPLVGITADGASAHHGVSVILGKADGTRLTHFVANPTEIRVGNAHESHALDVVITGQDGTTTIVSVAP
jgi:nucleotide-binding universal stress UspA family protein